MKCHYIYDKVAGKVLIPGCMGTVMFGIYHCTCRNDNSMKSFEKQQYNETVSELKKQISELEKENSRLNRIMKKLLKL